MSRDVVMPARRLLTRQTLRRISRGETQYNTSSIISSVRDARLLHVLVTAAPDVPVLVLVLVVPSDDMLVVLAGVVDGMIIKRDQFRRYSSYCTTCLNVPLNAIHSIDGTARRTELDPRLGLEHGQCWLVLACFCFWRMRRDCKMQSWRVHGRARERESCRRY